MLGWEHKSMWNWLDVTAEVPVKMCLVSGSALVPNPHFAESQTVRGRVGGVHISASPCNSSGLCDSCRIAADKCFE